MDVEQITQATFNLLMFWQRSSRRIFKIASIHSITEPTTEPEHFMGDILDMPQTKATLVKGSLFKKKEVSGKVLRHTLVYYFNFLHEKYGSCYEFFEIPMCLKKKKR